jgi:hypothetical protein
MLMPAGMESAAAMAAATGVARVVGVMAAAVKAEATVAAVKEAEVLEVAMEAVATEAAATEVATEAVAMAVAEKAEATAGAMEVVERVVAKAGCQTPHRHSSARQDARTLRDSRRRACSLPAPPRAARQHAREHTPPTPTRAGRPDRTR